jgi:hypothetical protein
MPIPADPQMPQILRGCSHNPPGQRGFRTFMKLIRFILSEIPAAGLSYG